MDLNRHEYAVEGNTCRLDMKYHTGALRGVTFSDDGLCMLYKLKSYVKLFVSIRNNLLSTYSLIFFMTLIFFTYTFVITFCDGSSVHSVFRHVSAMCGCFTRHRFFDYSRRP